jgi:tetratricopeptide (TPR) repeat protein
MLRDFINRILLLILCAGLIACSGGNVRPMAADEPQKIIPPEVSSRFAATRQALENGEAELAQRQLEKFVNEFPQYPGGWLNLSLLTAADGDLPEAIATLEAGVQRHPSYAPGLNQLGVWYREEGRFDDAVSAYTAALQADPGYSLAAYNLAIYYDLYQQQPERALGFYERYAALQPEPDKQVQHWIKDLQRRVVAARSTASKGDFR